MLKQLLPFLVLVIPLMCCAQQGEAAALSKSYSFMRITANSSTNVASQFSVVVSGDTTTSVVDFTFLNSSIAASSITDIYFQDGTLLGISSIAGSAGVSFSDPATPGNLPGGNLLTPDFVTTAGFSLDSNSPVSSNGINAATEWLTVTFALQSGKTITQTLAALDAAVGAGASGIWDDDGNYLSGAQDGLRIGMHVQALPDGQSDGFVNIGSPGLPNSQSAVPEPSSVAIFGLFGVAIFAAARRRK